MAKSCLGHDTNAERWCWLAELALASAREGGLRPTLGFPTRTHPSTYRTAPIANKCKFMVSWPYD